MSQLKRELSQSIPTELVNFDALPDSAHIRLPTMQGLYGVSAASISRGVRRGSTPSPTKLSERCTGWNVGLVRAALAAKAV
jgi:predicted DNA-binding transcriptional regulator AlpA|tara:strand:+ start:1940 stop:2182 length:243 start_codon:yes stop_codon:yes gene_type:complete